MSASIRPAPEPIHLSGTSDLACNGRKFSGNSQQRKRDHLLHHGTLLYDFDLDQVPRYLREPPRQPEYRQRRPHSDFLMNLPLSRESLTQMLREIWLASHPLESWPADMVEQLVEEKYGRSEWIRRR